jgi:hypothetical protein
MAVWYPAFWSSVATVVRALSKRLKTGTPLRCEYWPVRMAARLGVQIELVTNTSSSRIPSRARRSMCGVSFTREP